MRRGQRRAVRQHVGKRMEAGVVASWALIDANTHQVYLFSDLGAAKSRAWTLLRRGSPVRLVRV